MVQQYDVLVEKIAAVLDDQTADEAKVKAGVEKVANEMNLPQEDETKLVKFAEQVFKLSALDTETLVKKALGKLGDKSNEVDDFLAGVDAFIAEQNMDALTGQRVKVALALDVLSNAEMDAEGAAIWYKLYPQVQ